LDSAGNPEFTDIRCDLELTTEGIHPMHDDYNDDLSEFSDYIRAQIDRINWLNEMNEALSKPLEVTPDEFLDYLKTLSPDELLEVTSNPSFIKWRYILQYTDDHDFISNVLAFISAKPNLAVVERKTRVLAALAQNGGLTVSANQILLNLSDALSLDLEGDMALSTTLTDAQATKLAHRDDGHVLWTLAHNKHVPHVALQIIANRDDLEQHAAEDHNIIEELLGNPGCTPQIRKLVDPEVMEALDAVMASRLREIAAADDDSAFWAEFDPSTNYQQDLVAALNPWLPEEIAVDYAELGQGLLGAIARNMLDTESYHFMHFEDDDDDDDDDEFEYSDLSVEDFLTD
jgi:hypothetical protein